MLSHPTGHGLPHARPVRLGPDAHALCLGGHAFAAARDDALDDAAEQLLVHGQGLVAELHGVQEGVRFVEQLAAGRAHVVVAVQAPPHGAEQRGRDEHAADASGRELDGVVPVDDGLASGHLVRDVAERRDAVDHLVQDAAQRPHVARLAELHKLGTACKAASGGIVGIQERLRGHVVGGSDLGLAMDVDRLVGLDGVCDAEIDELQLASDKDEVGRLEVRVHDVVLVDRLEALEHLLPVEAHKGRVQSGRLGVLSFSHEDVQVELTHLHHLKRPNVSHHHDFVLVSDLPL